MTRLRRAQWMLGIVAFGLFVSGVTVWPALWELKTGIRVVWGDTAPQGTVHSFLVQVVDALEVVSAKYPFLLYGYDWLAFAHVVLAILFAGAIRDPVRNVWVVQFGLICCAMVPILAAICIPLRGIPWMWFAIDFAFAPGATIPLWVALRDIKHSEQRNLRN